MAGGRIILPITEPILNAEGMPASGSVLTIYNAGTQTLASLFSDSGLTDPIANPQTADTAGRFYDQATVLWGSDVRAYDATVAVAGGSTLTYDTIYTLGAQANTTGFAPINSPTFTGIPQAPTPASNDNSSKIATTSYVQSQGFAPLNSPALTGTPTAPTAAVGTNTTQLATMAALQAALLPANLATSFAQSLSASGYITLPGGLILQWNSVSPGDDSYVLYSLPVPFPTAFLGCVASVKYNAAKTGGNGGGAFCFPSSLTQIGVGIAWNGDATGIADAMYFAWGH